MKKLLPLAALLSAMALVGCGETPAASSPAKSSASTSTSKTLSSTTSKASSSTTSAPATSTTSAASQGEAWVKGADTKNSDDKTLTNYTLGTKAKVEIAITDASSGATDIGTDGKLGKGKTFTWKIVAPKAGNAKLQFCVKYGQSADNMSDSVRGTIWGNSGDGQQNYIVKNGTAEATVLVNGKTYQETGVGEGEGAYVDFATMAVTAGECVISLTTPSDQYYRNCFINNVALIIE